MIDVWGSDGSVQIPVVNEMNGGRKKNPSCMESSVQRALSVKTAQGDTHICVTTGQPTNVMPGGRVGGGVPSAGQLYLRPSSTKGSPMLPTSVETDCIGMTAPG